MIQTVIDLSDNSIIENKSVKMSQRIEFCKWCYKLLPNQKGLYHDLCEKKHYAFLMRRKSAIKHTLRDDEVQSRKKILRANGKTN
jgi:hypothetical protein